MKKQFEHGGEALGRVHRKANDKKFFCYFTGFLEGIISSGAIETDEVPPLIDQCKEFVLNVEDPDAADFVADFEVDLLEHESLVDAVSYRLSDIDKACAKSALNRFMGFCAGIACDDLIKLGEAEGAISFADEFPEILGDPVVRSIVHCCQDAVLDGEIDKTESVDICRAITRLVGESYADTGISSLGSPPEFREGRLPNDINLLEDEVVVLTGNFDARPRRIFEDELTDLGMIVAKTITQKTGYIIVGSEAARDWVSTHKGNKIIKALDLFDETGRPEMISEGLLKKVIANAKS